MEADRQWERRVRHLLKMPRNPLFLSMVVNEYYIGEGKKARQLLTLYIKNIALQALHYLIIGQGIVEKMGVLRGGQGIYLNVTSDKGDNKVAVITVFNSNSKRKMINLISTKKSQDECLDDRRNNGDYQTHDQEEEKRAPRWKRENHENSDLEDYPDNIAKGSVEQRVEDPNSGIQGLKAKVKGLSCSALLGIVDHTKTELMKIRERINSKKKTANKSCPFQSRHSIIKSCAIFVRRVFRKG